MTKRSLLTILIFIFIKLSTSLYVGNLTWTENIKNGRFQIQIGLARNFKNKQTKAKNLLKSVMTEFKNKTAIEFVPCAPFKATKTLPKCGTNGFKSWLVVTTRPKDKQLQGCSGYVGRAGDTVAYSDDRYWKNRYNPSRHWKGIGGQEISLDNNCLYKSKVTYLIMFALGWVAETLRPDRDNHVKIIWKNIPHGPARNRFDVRSIERYKTGEGKTFGTKYDVNSVMHYHNTESSKNGKPTMRSLDENNPILALTNKFHNRGLSEDDAFEVNNVYTLAEHCKTLGPRSHWAYGNGKKCTGNGNCIKRGVQIPNGSTCLNKGRICPIGKDCEDLKDDDWEPKCGKVCKEGWGCACKTRNGAPPGVIQDEDCKDFSQIGPAAIVYGKDASPGLFPWQVGIQVRVNKNGMFKSICGGTIINRRTILTAAHCFLNKKNGKLLYQVKKHSKVYVGFPTQLPDPYGDINMFSDLDVDLTNRTFGQGVFGIKEIKIHPDYNYDFKTKKLVYDAAILVLKDKIHYHKSIHPNEEGDKRAYKVSGFSWSRPACFSTGNWNKQNLEEYDSDGTQKSLCMASGYGKDENDNSGTLKFGLASILDSQTCMNKLTSIQNSPYKGSTDPLPKSYLCAEGKNAQNGDVESVQASCNGDSGGPMQCTFARDQSHEIMVQVGIVSWGIDKQCGKKSHPTVYTKISAIGKWLAETSELYGKRAQFAN